MALLVPFDRRSNKVSGQLTLTKIRAMIGGCCNAIQLKSGDFLFVRDEDESSELPRNMNAEDFNPGAPIYGDALLCSPEELE